MVFYGIYKQSYKWYDRLVAFILSMIYGIKTYHTHKVFEQEAISYSQTTITD